MDDPDRGPKFGAEGLNIPLQPKDNPRAVHCRLGTFYQKMPDGSPDPLLPTSPHDPSAAVMFADLDHPNKESPYVLDLRIGQIISRLRNPPPPPPQRSNAETLLPLPITTPWRLSAQLQALMRARARTRERARPRTEANPREDMDAASPSGTRTVPGGLGSSDIT